ncbi:MAG TPA: multiheme c-type cytochrome [Acidiferrobacterales bacterium]
MTHRRYLWVTLIAVLLAVPAGYAYVHWSKSGPGAGLYSRAWTPDPVHAYWDPDRFYESVRTLPGEFQGEECVACHQAVTPGIVNDWRASRHADPGPDRDPVYCSACHGANHQALRMPTPKVCGQCHENRVAEFLDERRYGFPSHALAMERAVDAKHFADKPKAEVASCLQCHSVATKCDSCHTRHRFSAAEARRPEACVTCHSGPPHPDDETYFASAHGRRYLAEAAQQDWSKPLVKGNYVTPTCAYCHMHGGHHQVADKTIWKFGLQEVNPNTSANALRRAAWVAVCSDCHEAKWSAVQLKGLDLERKRAWARLYRAEAVLKDLRAEDLLHPGAKQRPPYPMDMMERFFPHARIGYLDGQASAFYNVSPIERDYFEMWYFANLGAYKSAAHGDGVAVERWHSTLDRSLAAIETKAHALRVQGEAETKSLGRRADPRRLWLEGEYTEYNRERN